MDRISFLPSQVGSIRIPPLPWTGSPLRLLWSDIVLFFTLIGYLPGVFLPGSSRPDDELSLQSLGNVVSLLYQALLSLLQTVFLVSLPLCFMIPVVWFIVYTSAVLLLTHTVCRGLNGSREILYSKVDLGADGQHHEEHWIFVNGVAVGRHWLQANIDRLSLTFRRKITGVHNPTCGFVFDLIQCLIERSFCYPTQDVRVVHEQIREALLNEEYKKVVLILHSQGGIEGSLTTDWLLAEIPWEKLQRLEIYTFGSAANHFSNPLRNSEDKKAIRYIEHYANNGEFVAKWGVLNFTSIPNRYMGRVFNCPRSGHFLNQHYLSNMFPLDAGGRVLEDNEFMRTRVKVTEDGVQVDMREDVEESRRCSHGDKGTPKAPTVGDLSRLWLYRNGGSPHD